MAGQRVEFVEQGHALRRERQLSLRRPRETCPEQRRTQIEERGIGLIQAQAVRFADTAALFQALGGGWWNRSQDNTTAQGQKENNAE